MLKIGESLNSSIPKTLALLEPFDEAGVAALIEAQKTAGATVLDLNTALCSDELSVMRRLDAMTRAAGLVPMYDSPDPAVLEAMIRETQGDAFVNSVTLTERREILPVVAEALGAGRELFVVALPVGESLPATAEERRENVRNLLQGIFSAGVDAEHVFLDLLIEALATDTLAPARVLDTLDYVRENYPSVRTLCGLSNVSFGLPMRARLNTSFLSVLLARGMEGAIMNVTSPAMRCAVASLEALFGEDEYCMNYLSLYRELEG